MSLRIVLKYGLMAGLVIVVFAFLKSEWLYSGLYPDIFVTVLALSFALFGMIFRHYMLRTKDKEVMNDQTFVYREKLKQLSKREMEVLELLLTKRANKEIATQLHIELSTLKTHINSIYKKLEIKNRRDLRWISEEELIFN